MFDTIGRQNLMTPTPEEMRQQAEEAQRISKVDFKTYITKTYNLSEATSAKQYETDMQILIDGIAKRTHVIFHKDKQFVADQAAWLVNIEWGVFELKTEVVQTVGQPETEVKSKKESELITKEQEQKQADQGLETYG